MGLWFLLLPDAMRTRVLHVMQTEMLVAGESIDLYVEEFVI